MNCCCCGKPLRKNDRNGWHQACVKRFFGTNVIPQIEFDDHTLEEIAKENTNKGITVPGVQKKLSLHLHSDGNTPRLTLVNYPTGYILKPQVAEFECLPEAEQSVMTMADMTGISTVPHALIKSGNTFAYITKVLRFISAKTIWRTFESCNNYDMPNEIRTDCGVMEYWYAQAEKKARKWDIDYVKKHFPQASFKVFQAVCHGGLAALQPELLASELERVIRS